MAVMIIGKEGVFTFCRLAATCVWQGPNMEASHSEFLLTGTRPMVCQMGRAVYPCDEGERALAGLPTSHSLHMVPGLLNWTTHPSDKSTCNKHPSSALCNGRGLFFPLSPPEKKRRLQMCNWFLYWFLHTLQSPDPLAHPSNSCYSSCVVHQILGSRTTSLSLSLISQHVHVTTALLL